MKKWISLASVLLATLGVFAQDTTTVQTFEFSDITKRRGVYAFPSDTDSFRKIIMEMTLKCDPATTQDGFDCGEWDYLTYTYVYDHRGIYDSTYLSHPSFLIGNASPDSFEYVTNAVFDRNRETSYFLNRTATTSNSLIPVGVGALTTQKVLDLRERSGRSQYIFKASELTSAGLNAGDITGLDLDLDQGSGFIGRLEILIGHTTLDSLVGPQPFTALQTVFLQSIPMGTFGDFHQAFNWNGSDNIIVEFRFDNNNGYPLGNPVFKADSTSYPSGRSWSGTDYYLDFNGNRQEVNIGQFPELNGNSSKTIEAWAQARSFNNAGIWQAGQRGATGKDFSLRTSSTNDVWRVQHWGTPDYDATVAGSKDKWNHYAVTYNGSTSKLYVNGLQVAQENANLNTGSLAIQLARWQGSFFNGAIDQMRVWEDDLSGTTLEEYSRKAIDGSHPNVNSLLGSYDFDEGSGNFTFDNSLNNRGAAYLSNAPAWNPIRSWDLFKGMEETNIRPKVIFHQDIFTATLDSSFLYDTIYRAPVQIRKFENTSAGIIIADDETLYPNIATDTLTVWEAEVYRYTFDRMSGQKVDSVFINKSGVERNFLKEWYSPLARFEIGRFITPYGIGLDLGPDGFTWWYDVTDYAPLLRDSVDISTGNQQELVDLKFHMIKGEPTREVVGINRIWGQNRSYSYRNLDDDVSLSEKTLDLFPNTESYKVRTRITGHGHNSNDGNFPHCCEWKDNEHSLQVDGVNAGVWHIWQTHECALNPVYPQGGTWPGAREGWCPGDVVKNFDYEIEDYISGTEVKLDYSITPVPANNLGMGSGNYQMAMQLFQYGPYKSEFDAEVEEIISPSNKAYYSRQSLLCKNPYVVIRNNGSETLNKLNVYYGVSGGVEWVKPWFGTLGPNETTEVELDVTGAGFWSGNGQNMFTARVEGPNGRVDEYADNDALTVPLQIPDHYEGKVVISFTTNSAANENALTVKDLEGNMIVDWSTLNNTTTYTDTVQGNNSCYILEVTDSQDDGLSYWARPGQGSGALRLFIYNSSDVIVGVKAFESEFGNRLRYNFTVGDNAIGDFSPADTGAGPGTSPWLGDLEYDVNGIKEFYLSPNPTTNLLNVELIGLEGEVELEILDLSGKRVKLQKQSTENYTKAAINVSSLPAGVYLMNVVGDDFKKVKKFTKN